MCKKSFLMYHIWNERNASSVFISIYPIKKLINQACGFILKSWRCFPVWSVWLDAVRPLAQCRRCDVSQSRSAGSSIWTAGRASPIGRHHHQRPSLASSIGGPPERGTEHGRNDVIVADRASAGIGSVRLFIYLFINLFISPASNGWGPWLRLLLRQVQYHRRRHFVPRHGLNEGRSTGRPAAHPLLPGSDAPRGRRALAGPRLEAIHRAGGGRGGGPLYIKTLESIFELKVIHTATVCFTSVNRCCCKMA